MAGSLIPDKNLLVGAAAGLLSKAAMSYAGARGFQIDAETSGYVMVISTWLAAHIYDFLSGDNDKGGQR